MGGHPSKKSRNSPRKKRKDTSPYLALTAERVQQLVEDGFTPAQIDKVNKRELEKLDKMINAMTLTRLGPISTSEKELRIVIVGKTGAGKSSLGNLIIGRESFKDSFGSDSYTSTIQQESCEVDNIRVKLIDTPGLIDTKKSTDTIVTEVAKVFENFSDGIHAFLFVFNLGNPRYTEEEKKAFEHIKGGMLGPKFLDHCFVVITNGSNLYSKTTLTAYLDGERSSDFGHLLNNTIGRKVIVVENSEETEYGRSDQQQQVIRMIAAKVKGVYTNEAMNKYKEDQEATAAKFRGKAKDLVQEIGDALSRESDGLPNEQIKDMSPKMRAKIIESALEEVMKCLEVKSGKRDITRDEIDIRIKLDIKEALDIYLTAKIERLTEPSYLRSVEFFGVGLLTAAGVMLLPTLAAFAAPAVAVGAAVGAAAGAAIGAVKAVGAVGSATVGFAKSILGW